MPNIDNAQVKRSALDVFIDKMFKFGKIIAAIFMLVSVLSMIVGLCYFAFARPDKIEIPRYEKGSVANASSGNKGPINDSVEENVDPTIGLQYNAEIKKIVKLIGETSEFRHEVILLIDRVSPDHRTSFVEGMIEYLEDCKQQLRGRFSGKECVDRYFQKFKRAEKIAKDDANETESRRFCAIIASVSSIGAFISFLVIPLLIRIEENTRKIEEIANR